MPSPADITEDFNLTDGLMDMALPMSAAHAHDGDHVYCLCTMHMCTSWQTKPLFTCAHMMTNHMSAAHAHDDYGHHVLGQETGFAVVCALL
eukprot:1143893-Pelagomonas_calceolata.AAC.12